ncbi:MAG: hypothetical protein A2086_11635 [Spirochaetes bacterium GWD1_27_9]|nr:MAG: hypothetical protein A2Z98_12060 [Spirochaetes bacterium GWB1_27_13]OHD26450.1 MAG: hypothetical protein A2Y34_10095 [Spirochaetes bacterium GWC1_27_15]OHD36384.1 MAG: hypothetical protein A2086_11635 [Spirochaetes bacterium GWD1_27_9]
MALLKTIETTSGFNALYWTIKSFNLIKDCNNRIITVSVDGYKDEEARINKKTSIETKSFKFTFEENEITKKFNNLNLIYSNFNNEKSLGISGYLLLQDNINLDINTIKTILLSFIYEELKKIDIFKESIDLL